MPIRREVHLILWVTALALVVAMIFRATLPLPTDVGAEPNLIDTVVASDPDSADQLLTTRPWSRELVEAPGTSRLLFPVAALPTAIVTPPVEQVMAEPVLKGTVRSENGLRAVFLDPADGSYRTLGVGDTMGPFRVTAVEADRASMTSPQGDRLFHLRGPGESP